MATLDIRNFTRGREPRLPFAETAKKVLPGWDLSLVIAGRVRAQSLNKSLRNKAYVPNVLSYKVGSKSGEIILCPEVACREAHEYGHKADEHLLFLFIHGLLHLKGLRHGATMDKQERNYLRNALPLKSKWHDASQPASISERTKRKSSSLKR